MMLALPGSSYLYQGEELGLPEHTTLAPGFRQDPTFFRTKGERVGRDGCRVPLPWTKTGSSFGFGSGGSHLPQPSWYGSVSVETQDGVQGSTLELYRKLINLRKQLQTSEEITWHRNWFAPKLLHFSRPGGWHCVTNFGNTDYARKNNDTTGHVSVGYSFENGVNAYLAYATSFLPQPGMDIDGKNDESADS